MNMEIQTIIHKHEIHVIFDNKLHVTSSDDKLDKILETLFSLTTKINQMAQELEDLKVKVTANGDVIQSAIALIQGIKQKLDEAIANGNDPAALQALSDQLGSQDQALADAVAANTPAA